MHAHTFQCKTHPPAITLACCRIRSKLSNSSCFATQRSRAATALGLCAGGQLLPLLGLRGYELARYVGQVICDRLHYLRLQLKCRFHDHTTQLQSTYARLQLGKAYPAWSTPCKHSWDLQSPSSTDSFSSSRTSSLSFDISA